MSILFKFAATASYDEVPFDGISIRVLDLKRAIVEKRGMDKATDFDLVITNAETKEEYKRDDDTIMKNTSVVVKRVPAKAGHGLLNKLQKSLPAPGAHHTGGATHSNLAASSGNGAGGGTAAPPQRRHFTAVPHSGYVCFRCGVEGHFIQDCPTNGDPAFDKVARPINPIGIPRALMKRLDADNATTLEADKMLVAVGKRDGEGLAYFAPNVSEFERMRERMLQRDSVADVPPNLTCPLCHELFVEAVLLPCCGKTTCDSCARSTLVNSGLTCPLCAATQVSPDKLVPNRTVRDLVNQFIREHREQERARAHEEAAEEARNVKRVPIFDPAAVAAKAAEDASRTRAEAAAVAAAEAAHDAELDTEFGGGLLSSAAAPASSNAPGESADGDGGSDEPLVSADANGAPARASPLPAPANGEASTSGTHSLESGTELPLPLPLPLLAPGALLPQLGGAPPQPYGPLWRGPPPPAGIFGPRGVPPPGYNAGLPRGTPPYGFPGVPPPDWRGPPMPHQMNVLPRGPPPPGWRPGLPYPPWMPLPQGAPDGAPLRPHSRSRSPSVTKDSAGGRSRSRSRSSHSASPGHKRRRPESGGRDMRKKRKEEDTTPGEHHSRDRRGDRRGKNRQRHRRSRSHDRHRRGRQDERSDRHSKPK